jgi:hypothetical protein
MYFVIGHYQTSISYGQIDNSRLAGDEKGQVSLRKLELGMKKDFKNRSHLTSLENFSLHWRDTAPPLPHWCIIGE